MINQTQMMMQDKKIIYNTEVVKANPCDYNYAYILIRGNITIACNIGERVAFKNCALFTNCITKITGTTIDNAEDLVWLSQCITYYNTVRITLVQQVHYRFILKMKQLILISIL